MIRLNYQGGGGWIAHPEPGRKQPPAQDFIVCTPREFAELAEREPGLIYRIVPDPEKYAAPLLEGRAVDPETGKAALPPLYKRATPKRSRNATPAPAPEAEE